MLSWDDECVSNVQKVKGDLLKQLLTVDAVLLTFGVAFVKDMAAGSGPRGVAESAIVFLLLSIYCSVGGLCALAGIFKHTTFWVDLSVVLFLLALSSLAIFVMFS